ncbi:amino acid transporter [Xylariaceae sp. FL0804]|nr:amino acid transporter [Xylariaceae sp. FL0804]
MKSSALSTVALCLGAASAVAAAPSKRDASTCTEIRQRVPWQNLTATEKSDYINADLCLMNAPSQLGIEGAISRWDDLQWPHVYQTVWVHNVGAFLPFHRYYMTVHERMIKDECNYTGRMPYWDEVNDLPLMNNSVLWEDDAFGPNGGEDNCIVEGPFANKTQQWEVGGTYDTHCITRSFNLEIFADSAPQTEIDACNDIDNYEEAWVCWSGSPHRAGHNGVGGTMGDPTLSPGDPVFYLHHTYLDKLWWEWQEANLTARLTDMGGANLPNSGANQENAEYPGTEYTDYWGDPGNVTTLDHVLYMFEIYPNVTIGDIMDIGGDVVCSEYL